jgi:hypothetical protein
MYVAIFTIVLYNILTCFFIQQKEAKSSRRFFLILEGSFEIIDTSPLQVSISAIVFAPKQSVVRKIFRNQFPAWLALPPKVDSNWDACSVVADSLAFWPWLRAWERLSRPVWDFGPLKCAAKAASVGLGREFPEAAVAENGRTGPRFPEAELPRRFLLH